MDTIHTVRAGEGQHVLLGADIVTVKAGSAETAGNMLVFEVQVPAGGGPPTLHRHGYSEVFYVLDGTFEISTLDADQRVQSVTLGVGDSVAIPSMVWHNFKNIAAAPSTMLAVHSSPIMEGLLHELGRPIADLDHMPAGPPPHEGQEYLLRVVGKYMEMLPPEAIARASNAYPHRASRYGY